MGVRTNQQMQLWLKLSGIGDKAVDMCNEDVYRSLLNIADLNPDFQNSPSTIQIEVRLIDNVQPYRL